jgi:hypothetical protein
VTRDLGVLLALVVIGAGLLVVHVLLMLRVARARRLPVRVRLLGLLPPATPIVGWLAGARGLVVAWALHCFVYGLLLALA